MSFACACFLPYLPFHFHNRKRWCLLSAEREFAARKGALFTHRFRIIADLLDVDWENTPGQGKKRAVETETNVATAGRFVFRWPAHPFWPMLSSCAAPLCS
jgi:hypothetical protein